LPANIRWIYFKALNYQLSKNQSLMKIGEIIYWVLWLPMFITKLTVKAAFWFWWFLNFLHQVGENLHEEIKEI